MNIVLFLGAGFSKPFGLPVMNEFFAFADNSPRISDSDRDFLGRLLLAARRANSFLESSPTNLEDILSFAVMGERLNLQFDGEAQPGVRIRRILRQVYTHVSEVATFWDRYATLAEFLGFFPAERRHDLAFITTNYDLNIECALHNLNSSSNPGFEIKQRGEHNGALNSMYSSRGIPVFKLHGSVNWYPSEASPGVEIDGHFVNEIDTSGKKPTVVRMPQVLLSDDSQVPPPVIIPPSFLKQDLPRALGQVWEGAARALQRAHVVVFVGYSFPQSDTEMAYFLARALSDNPTLRRIDIVDPDAFHIFERLRAADSKYGSHFKSLLRDHNQSTGWTGMKMQWDLDAY